MSEMVGSCSSGSSGPRPKTSSSTSSLICCFSSELSSVGSASISEITAWRTSAAHPLVVDGGQRFQVDLVHQLAVQGELQFLILGLQGGLLAPEFFSSLCSQETCWVFLLPLSSVENIRIRQTLSCRESAGLISRAGCADFLQGCDGGAQPRGHVLDGLAQLAFGAQRLAQRHHAVQRKIVVRKLGVDRQPNSFSMSAMPMLSRLSTRFTRT
jgi:hypothetical protein